jgi:uncharacterized protein involved in response to NO
VTRSQDSSAAGFAPFAYGFRPFFLAALVYAPLAVLVWLWTRVAGSLPVQELLPQLWHGHEMLFGFVAAAIAGFLLTAVPSWTGAKGFAGTPLIVLAALWLAGRLVFLFAAWVPMPVLIAAELLFFPALLILLTPPLLRARNRNTRLLFVLVALWSADAVYLYAMVRADILLASTVLRVGIDIVLLLITVMGGRIVPAFTGNALRLRGIEAKCRSSSWLEVTVITAMALAIVIDAVAPFHVAAIVVSAVAALAHALRLAGWQGWRTLKDPIVWVLHLAYAWLPVGLALKATFLLTGMPWAMQWLHALTMGAIAMMVVSVVTRASLGHTGRPLAVSRSVAAAYGLLAAAVLVRVFGGVTTGQYEWTLQIAGGLWIIAFGVILVTYLPILVRPRIDGRAG